MTEDDDQRLAALSTQIEDTLARVARLKAEKRIILEEERARTRRINREDRVRRIFNAVMIEGKTLTEAGKMFGIGGQMCRIELLRCHGHRKAPSIDVAKVLESYWNGGLQQARELARELGIKPLA